MKKTYFEWDEDKDQENQNKHNVPFSLAQHAFMDPIASLWRMRNIVPRKIDIIA